MAFVANPHVAEVNVNYTLFGQIVQNVLYFVITGEWDESSLTELAGNVIEWVITDLLPHLSEDLALKDVSARSMASTSAPAVVVPPTGTHVGGDAQPSQPSNVTWTVKFATAFRGRSGRGRNYVPGLGASQVSSDVVASTEIAALLTAYRALASFLTVAGAQHCVYSRFTGGAPRSTGLAEIVTSYTYADAFSDSQRRRLVGRGR